MILGLVFAYKALAEEIKPFEVCNKCPDSIYVAVNLLYTHLNKA